MHASWASLSDDLQTGCDATGSVRCHYWMAEIKHLYNRHLYHLSPESWHSYRGGKKQYWVTFHLCRSLRWKKYISVKSNQKSGIKQAIKIVQPTLCPLHSVSGWLHCVISRPECLWILRSYYLPLCTWKLFGTHHQWNWMLSVWEKKKKEINKAENILQASYLLCGYPQMSDSEVHQGQPETCWAGELWRIHSLIQQLSQRFSEVGKNNFSS